MPIRRHHGGLRDAQLARAHVEAAARAKTGGSRPPSTAEQTPRRVVGGLRIDGAEAWDEAILLVNPDTKEVKLFLAAQYKVEKQVSALRQTQNDALRETATASGKLPKVSFILDGVPQYGFDLTPMPVGKASHRFVFNAGGGRISSRAIDQLRAAGIEVNQLNLDISVPEFDQVARTLIDVVADIVP